MKYATHDERIQVAVQSFKYRLEELERCKEVADRLLDLPIIKNQATNGYVSVGDGGISIRINHMDVPFVIDQICGPIHRQFGCDWTMDLENHYIYNSPISLKTKIERKKLGLPPSFYGRLFKVEVVVAEEEMKTCKLVTEKVRLRTEEEIQEAVENLRWVTTQKINCTGMAA